MSNTQPTFTTCVFRTRATVYPCSFCQRYTTIFADGWTHGFGWSKCPECSAVKSETQPAVMTHATVSSVA